MKEFKDFYDKSKESQFFKFFDLIDGPLMLPFLFGVAVFVICQFFIFTEKEFIKEYLSYSFNFAIGIFSSICFHAGLSIYLPLESKYYRSCVAEYQTYLAQYDIEKLEKALSKFSNVLDSQTILSLEVVLGLKQTHGQTKIKSEFAKL